MTGNVRPPYADPQHFPPDHNEAALAPAHKLYIEYVTPELLKPDPKNPRVHKPQQIRLLVPSIKKHGLVLPLVVDNNLNVVSGHACLMAALEIGMTEVPIVRISHLSDHELRVLQIGLNRLAELSSWDDKLLGEALRDLSVAGIDLDLELTGFTMAEIDLSIEELIVTHKGEPDPADLLPVIDRQPVVSRLGDIWKLGRHRLLCGSALDPAAYQLLNAGELAAANFCDPPYNVNKNMISGLGAVKHAEFVQGSGEMSDAEFTNFLATSFTNIAKACAPGALIYACMDWRHIDQIVTAGRTVFGDYINLCVWAKTSAGMGSLYRSQHELIPVFRNGSARHRNNVQLGKYGRNRTNVWNYPGISNFGRPGEEGILLHLHPTVKPVALVADAIMDCTARGELVLDPFCGSGTTIIAAERVGRRCNAMELDPRYVDVIIRRWQAYTGDQACHAASGRRFDDIAAEQGVHHDIA